MSAEQLPCQTILDNLYDGVYVVDGQRRITYWNSGAERISGYARWEVEGRCCADNLLNHTDTEGNVLCQTDCPVTATLRDGEHRHGEVFLRHKEGHRVPIVVRVAPITDDGGAIIGAVEVFSDNSASLARAKRLAELEADALSCPLTRIGNRRFIDMCLQARLQEYERYNWPCGVIMADIDHFKAVNDTYGHPTGDAVLCMVAKTLQNSVRSCDNIGRWGGEEFLIVLPNIQHETLMVVAERCLRLVRESRLPLEHGNLGVTISMGCACIHKGDTLNTLLARADSLLYISKENGRNRITLEDMNRF